MNCESHDKKFEWIPIAPGKKVYRCPDCHAGVKAEAGLVHEFPKIKWAQSFFRDRPYNELEKSTPFGIAKKPSF